MNKVRRCDRISVAFCILALVIAATSSDPVHAQETEEEPRQASGSFESRHVELPVWGAYAFEGKVGSDDQPGIHLAISNYEFNTGNIDEYWDRELWINERFVNDEYYVAWFYFTPDGRYVGLSYFFGSGDGCGLCFSPETDSTAKVSDGRIAGTLELKDNDGASFDLTFDIPVAPTDFGDALPANGGEPGNAYRAYHEALAGGEADSIRPTMESYWNSHFEDGQGFIDFLRKLHPDSYVVKQGFIQGDRAVLLASGKHRTLGDLRVEVHLLREEDRWVYSDELVKISGW